MSHIKLSVPNDDSCALFHIGKSLIDLSSTIEGAPYWVVITQKEYDELQAFQRLQQATEKLMQGAPAMLKDNNVEGSIEIHGKRKEPEIDSTVQQVESLAIPVEANGATYEIDLDSDNPQAVPVADSTGTPWDERIHSASKALNSDGTWRVRRKPKDMDEAEWLQFMDSVMIEITPDNGSDDMGEVVDQSINAAHKAVAEQYGQGLANAAFTGDRTKSPEPPVTPAGDDFHVDAGVVTEQQVAATPAPPLPPVAAKVLREEGFNKAQELVSQPAEPTEALINLMNSEPKYVRRDDTDSYTFPQVMKFLTERHARISSTQVEQIIREMGLTSIMDLNTQPEHTGPFIARVKTLLGE